MKKALLLFCLLNLLQINAQHAASKRYLFFLHNRFIEELGLEASHPEYGRAEYAGILQAFKQEGLAVISEVRAKNTDGKTYALKVKGQIDSLLKAGVLPANITVVGTSKGGYIAALVSGMAQNSALNFVIIGYCPDEDPAAAPEFNISGNILFIYEKSDAIAGSCIKLKTASAGKIGRFKEIELNTGLKHGFLYKPLKEWIAPSVAWARQDP